jgi:hypothetical protein
VRSLAVTTSVPFSRPALAYTPRQPAQPVKKTDPNQLYAQIAQSSTFQVQGVDYQQPQTVTENNAAQVQNVANWDSIQGEQTNPLPRLGKTIPMQTEATATLQIPIAASGGQQAVLALDKAIEVSGEVVLPAGTLMKASVQPDNGIMNLRLDTAYVNGQQVAIPGDSIMVLNSNKQFLLAQSFAKKSGIGRDIRDFAFGVVGGVAEQALTPSSSTTISSNGFSSSTVNNASRNLTNSFLGGVKGGVSNLIQNVQSRNQSSAPQNVGNGLKAGTRVRLVFTAPTDI